MEKFNKIREYLKRNVILFVIIIIIYYIAIPGVAEIKTVMFIVSIEILAILLSGLAIYTYTSIQFFKLLNEGTDDNMNRFERHAVLEIIGKIFLSVHLLVGLGIIGIYAVAPI